MQRRDLRSAPRGVPSKLRKSAAAGEANVGPSWCVVRGGGLGVSSWCGMGCARRVRQGRGHALRPALPSNLREGTVGR